MHARSQILEGELERLITENTHLREAHNSDLGEQSFDLEKYLVWRSSYKKNSL